MKKLNGFLCGLVLLVGCSKPPEKPWSPPAKAQWREELEDIFQDDRMFTFLSPTIQATGRGRGFEGVIIGWQFDPDENWATFEISMEWATKDKHRLLVLAQDIQQLANFGLEKLDREPNSIRIDICDRNRNWIAGTDPEGNMVVKP